MLRLSSKFPVLARRARQSRAAGMRRHDAGMTITEVLIVVVIIGVVAASTQPMFRRDRVASEGRAFAGLLTREFQQARQNAIGTRLRQRAFVFSDRVEVRSAIAGTPPVDATVTSPIMRNVQARTGVSIWDVTTSLTAPASAVLTTGTYKVIEWNTFGQATIVGTVTPAISLYVRNASAGVAQVNSRYRIDVSPLSGAVSLVETW
jgi:prepilin-type N-terminal cleavage/methylation domain-containing protein